MSDKSIYFKNLPFWEHLSSDEKKLIIENSTITEYEKGRIIHSDEDKCLGMIYIISGEIRTYLLSEGGREITLFKLYDNDSCALSASCIISEITFPSQMKAEKDCKVLIISSSIFSKIANQNIYLKCYMYELLTKRFSSVVKTMEQLLFLRFDKRLATFLLSECKRTGSREIHMTHEQIAQHINSAREVVARMLKRFELNGLVELKRGSIKIIDIEKIKTIND